MHGTLNMTKVHSGNRTGDNAIKNPEVWTNAAIDSVLIENCDNKYMYCISFPFQIGSGCS